MQRGNTVPPAPTGVRPSDPSLAERYRVLGTITPGVEDVLYLARRLDTGAVVELRTLSGRLGGDRVLVTALVQQATLVARVSGQCPGLATVHEYERTNGSLVVVLEHPEGPTLRDVIKQDGTLDRRRALILATRLAEILERVHNLGLVHGGLCPENIVLAGPDDNVVLKQFGFDWVVRSRSPEASDRGGSPAEEPVYRAPEQTWDEVTHRSDIYAFGAIVYEMLAGRRVPAATSPHPRVSPEPLTNCRADITPGLERIVMQALQVAPERRPADISTVCNALKAELAADGQTPAREPGTLARLFSREGTTKRLAWGGAIVLGALAVWYASPRITLDTSSWKPSPAPAPLAPVAPEAPPSAGVTAPARPPEPVQVLREPADARASREDPAAPSIEPGTRQDVAATSVEPVTRHDGAAPSIEPAARQESPATSTQPVTRTTSPPKRPAETRDGQTPRVVQTPPPTVASPPVESSIQTRKNDGWTQVPSREGAITTPRRDKPAPPPRAAADEVANDPGAIINWLINESGGKGR